MVPRNDDERDPPSDYAARCWYTQHCSCSTPNDGGLVYLLLCGCKNKFRVKSGLSLLKRPERNREDSVTRWIRTKYCHVLCVEELLIGLICLFSSSVTPATQTRCYRLYTSASLSETRYWNTRHGTRARVGARPRRLC